MRKEKVPGLSLAIAHLADVFLGKKTPEFLSLEGLFANTDHCLSLMSRKTSLHMEFKTQQVREAWLVGIKNAYATAGRPVKEMKPGDAPGTRVITIVSSKKVDAVKVSPVLLEGRAFVRYWLVNGQVKKKRIHIWLVKQEGTLGSLYWEEMVTTGKQPLTPVAEQCIPISKISDVYIGKQTPLFQTPSMATVPMDCCLSIASQGVTLDLAAKFPRDRKEWLTAIHTVFLSSGKKVVENEHSVTKIVLDQPVWTPLGEGLAERYPRNDGITAVQLKWATAYVNLQSIHRLVQVETPLGLARLLPGEPNRADGTVRVQLPWGESYVNKKDVKPLATTLGPVIAGRVGADVQGAHTGAVLPHRRRRGSLPAGQGVVVVVVGAGCGDNSCAVHQTHHRRSVLSPRGEEDVHEGGGAGRPQPRHSLHPRAARALHPHRGLAGSGGRSAGHAVLQRGRRRVRPQRAQHPGAHHHRPVPR